MESEFKKNKQIGIHIQISYASFLISWQIKKNHVSETSLTVYEGENFA